MEKDSINYNCFRCDGKNDFCKAYMPSYTKICYLRYIANQDFKRYKQYGDIQRCIFRSELEEFIIQEKLL